MLFNDLLGRRVRVHLDARAQQYCHYCEGVLESVENSTAKVVGVRGLVLDGHNYPFHNGGGIQPMPDQFINLQSSSFVRMEPID